MLTDINRNVTFDNFIVSNRVLFSHCLTHLELCATLCVILFISTKVFCDNIDEFLLIITSHLSEDVGHISASLTINILV